MGSWIRIQADGRPTGDQFQRTVKVMRTTSKCFDLHERYVKVKVGSIQGGHTYRGRYPRPNPECTAKNSTSR